MDSGAFKYSNELDGAQHWNRMLALKPTWHVLMVDLDGRSEAGALPAYFSGAHVTWLALQKILQRLPVGWGATCL